MLPPLSSFGLRPSRVPSGITSSLSSCLILLAANIDALTISRDHVLAPRNLDNFGQTFPAMLNAVATMQSQYFSSGSWPSAIDWTAAVINTQTSAAASAIAWANQSDNTLVDHYFAQVKSFYNAENTAAVAGEAYDDMQWVVLEWLEAIKFVNLYTSLQPSASSAAADPQSTQASAHRANQFWELATVGWDTTLCGGGMNWNPRLTPYKNAITNELYVASSVGMYLYSTGDPSTNPPAIAHDPKHLNAAVEAYRWLSASNMTNAQGLYVDGFHISGWTSPTNIGSGKCDQRDESVYTYNQGVLLSGLRGLWEATGTQSYLDDGHSLISSVITATGWPATSGNSWAGIGSNGILQDNCDAGSSCSQDSQTFKGIFFHHLAIFCAPLPTGSKKGVEFKADAKHASTNAQICASYTPWIKHNAQGAYSTLTSAGDFGMWWGAASGEAPSTRPRPHGATDYRNKGVPDDKTWRLPNSAYQQPAGMVGPAPAAPATDPNTGGRGRTVETQQGGLAVLRALLQCEE